ncbi:Uncharacterised protein [Bordetella pertussis]|nr:Uncharacterised protein [Bordetella pertussis]CFW03778.1 Uncharacterised protein [Bordetella pertussis]
MPSHSRHPPHWAGICGTSQANGRMTTPPSSICQAVKVMISGAWRSNMRLDNTVPRPQHRPLHRPSATGARSPSPAQGSRKHTRPTAARAMPPQWRAVGRSPCKAQANSTTQKGMV